MYNYQTFLREQHLNQQCSAIRREYINAEIKRQQSMPALAHAHKKRVEGFILSAIDKPVPVSQYQNKPPCFRNTSTEGFYIRRQSQSQRIESEMKSNSELDHIPFNNSSNHQFREAKGKGLKYKPLTQSMRVKEFLDRQELNYLPNSLSKPDKLLKKVAKGEHVEIDALNRSINKTLLPVLHAKTYFKSVSTLYTQIPVGLRSDTVGLLQEGVEDGEGDPRRAVKPKDHLSRKQNSKQALIKCNMLPLRV